MPRFFISAEQIKGNQVLLAGSDQHHLLNVLRKKVGDEIRVLNGQGEEYQVVLKEIGQTAVIGEIITKVEQTTEPRVKLTLIQGLPKADKFEWIMQKNTELGVSCFQPVITERSTVKLDGELRLKKWDRWQKIIKAAAQQSGRKVVPRLEMIKDWEILLSNLPEGLTLMPWEGEQDNSLKSVLENEKILPMAVNILIGPEGGFSLDEVQQAKDVGAIPVTLGPRILRTETAGLVAATAVLYHFGDLG